MTRRAMRIDLATTVSTSLYEELAPCELGYVELGMLQLGTRLIFLSGTG